MCMFYNTPEQKRITKPITAYKVFTRHGKYPFQNKKPKTNRWLRARAPKGEFVKSYGFHVFTNKRDAIRFNTEMFYYTNSVVKEIKIRGTVYGVGSIYDYPSGMRVSSIYIPKRKTKKK